MKTKFLIFFTFIILTGLFSIVGGWIIQLRLDGEINLLRAVFQIALLVITLYLLWRKNTSGYILANLYAAGNLAISAFAVFGYVTLWNVAAEVPINSLIFSSIVVFVSLSALMVFLFDYLDYRQY